MTNELDQIKSAAKRILTRTKYDYEDDVTARYKEDAKNILNALDRLKTEPEVACTGCGRVGEDLPPEPAISCCPERNMIPVQDLINRLWKKAYDTERAERTIRAMGALRKAQETFAHYADLHSTKGTEDGNAKAARNLTLANEMAEVIKKLEENP